MYDLKYLPDVLVLLSASIFIIVLLKRLRLSSVLGYLIVGAIIGEHGFNLIQEPKYSQNFAEFGVVFLLFVIGLEITFERITRMRLHVFGFGTLQLVITSLLLFIIFYYIMKMKAPISIVIAAAMSLSSTAIVLQVLQERQRQSTQVGRLSLAVLLMQDFAVVPLLAILPLLVGKTDYIISSIAMSTLKALGAIVAFTIIGRVVIRPLFSIIGSAKSDEVYVPTTLVIVLGAAMITNSLGLSTAMGAFLAGLVIAETEYRTRVEHSIMPFKSLFLGLFFMTVGMSINIEFIIDNLKSVALAAAALILIKTFIIFCLCKLFRFPTGAALHSGLLLSQGSEFAFILFDLSYQQRFMTADLSQFLLMTVALSMAVTPLISIIGEWLESKLDNVNPLDYYSLEYKGIGGLDSHVIIAGFGRAGRMVAYMLSQEQIPYVAIDGNAQLVKAARKQGFNIYHGNSIDMDTFKAVGASRAKCVILTMSEKAALRKTVKNLKAAFDKLQIITRVEDFKHAAGLRKLGSFINVPSTIETGLQLGGALLKTLGIPEKEIVRMKETVRKDDYSLTEEIELFHGIAPTKIVEE